MNPLLKERLIGTARTYLRPQGKDRFVADLPCKAVVLDVGCGNNSALRVKHLRPDIHYLGIDVTDYQNTLPPESYADEYIVTSPVQFATRIAALKADAIISSHNIEHCDDPDAVLDAMCAALKPDGRLYLAFPCEQSIRFPTRKQGGCLNFYDHPQHRVVPKFSEIVRRIEANGLTVEYASRRYRPAFLALAGLLFEPYAALRGKMGPLGCTWALYGFESVIWAQNTPSI